MWTCFLGPVVRLEVSLYSTLGGSQLVARDGKGTSYAVSVSQANCITHVQDKAKDIRVHCI